MTFRVNYGCRRNGQDALIAFAACCRDNNASGKSYGRPALRIQGLPRALRPDSQYAVDCLTKWMDRHVADRKECKIADVRDVRNRDPIGEALRLDGLLKQLRPCGVDGRRGSKIAMRLRGAARRWTRRSRGEVMWRTQAFYRMAFRV
ncbi:unnamed protein product [Discula destructiva]